MNTCDTINPNLMLLDGGMARQLQQIGAPFRQPEWSALSLIEAPNFVIQVHQDFIEAGADIITTNAYAVVPFHIGQERFDQEGFNLAHKAVKLARQASHDSDRHIYVAGCLPPVMGSYRSDFFDAKSARKILDTLVRAQEDDIDFWLAETISSIAEAKIVAQSVSHTDKDLWLSYTITDRENHSHSPTLRSGENLEEACYAAKSLGVKALLFNCSQPEEMEDALRIAHQTLEDTDIKTGAYANAFPPIKKDQKANATITDLRADITPEAYRQYARKWIDAGATIIGGCCGIGPEHIRALSQMDD